MTQFIAVPLKRTSEINLVKPLQNLLSEYSNVIRDEALAESIERLDRLRKDATFKGIDGRSVMTLSALQQYYDQLRFFINKCPVDKVEINFKWKDAFNKSSFLKSTPGLILRSLAYERVCVLFNIGACYSTIAATALNIETLGESDLHLAVKYFQIASGIFLSLINEVQTVIGEQPQKTNMEPSILNILHHLMLAQAQESIFIKALRDKISDVNISRLCSQCADYYSVCHKGILSVKSIWPERDWLKLIQTKQYFFSAISDFHMSVDARVAEKLGDEIAWLSHAVDTLEQAENKIHDLPQLFQSYQRKIKRRYEEAVRENDFIYHARVPNYSDLMVVERYNLVKPIPVSPRFAPEFADLFATMFPLKVHNKQQTFETTEAIVTIQRVSPQSEIPNSNTTLVSSEPCQDSKVISHDENAEDKLKKAGLKDGINYVSKLMNSAMQPMSPLNTCTL